MAGAKETIDSQRSLLADLKAAMDARVQGAEADRKLLEAQREAVERARVETEARLKESLAAEAEARAALERARAEVLSLKTAHDGDRASLEIGQRSLERESKKLAEARVSFEAERAALERRASAAAITSSLEQLLTEQLELMAKPSPAPASGSARSGWGEEREDALAAALQRVAEGEPPKR